MGSLFKRWRCWIRVVFGIIVIVLVAVVVVIGAVVFAPNAVRTVLTKIDDRASLLARYLPPALPPATTINRAYWLNQNWTGRDRYWFHHTTQGTATFPVPYDWFVALARPELSLFGSPGLLKDEDYLRRFGFIPSPNPDELKRNGAKFGYHGDGAVGARDVSERDRLTGYPENNDGLPVGFAKMNAGTDPTTGQPYPSQVGFTCAACHTGHIEYNNVSIRFDGGPAMVDLGNLEGAVALSIGYTLQLPWRFNSFADRVSKLDNRWNDKTELKQKLQATFDRIVSQLRWENQILARGEVKHLDEGYGRLDALNRIGNQVFFEDMLPAEILKNRDAKLVDSKVKETLPTQLEPLTPNFVRRDAPVSFPPLWDAPWFLWAQYDASIFNELVRNAGEALGVNAKLNMTMATNDKQPLFRSSVQVLNIYWFEEMLRGSDPFAAEKPGDLPKFKGLIAPKWSEVADIFKGDAAWQIDQTKLIQGRGLYRELCVECHRGPVNDPEFDKQWPDYSFWRKENPDGHDNWVAIGDRTYFNVVQMPVADVGTDRQQSRVLTERKVALPPELKIDPVDYLNGRWGCELPKDEALNSSFALALMAVVDKTVLQWIKDNQIPPDIEQKMWGTRPNCQNKRVFKPIPSVDAAAARPPVVVVPHYRARPLDGVWATAPYLHNGSVPTVHDMLMPQLERPKLFCVGSRQFDPRKVGLAVPTGASCGTGVTRFDVTGLGNSNLGHSFQGTETDKDKLPAGVLGRALTPSERDALVEYLKTL
jgi:mono/diheme cytochrome c family protein